MLYNNLNEKIDYSKDPEAPITIGLKLLNKIEKDWGKGSDIYGAIDEIIVFADIKHPKQLALRLKRTLENYDMWHAPYKGLVNKIEKWQFVNEGFVSFAGKVATNVVAHKLANKLSANENTNREASLRYYRPMDVKELMKKSKTKGVQLSKFEYYVLDAAMWARSRSNNYHGYSDVIPAVEYKNGKFYAQTTKDGMTEVPFNYNVMTPKFLELTENSKCPKSGCIKKKPNNKWGVISAKTGKFWNANYKTKGDAEDALKAYHINENDNNDEVYMIVYANDNFSIDDIKRFIIIHKDDIVYEDDQQIEFYTIDQQDIQDELDCHGIEWEVDMNY